MTVGYSGTPLPKKLGLKASTRLFVINGPPDYEALLGEPTPGLKLVIRKELRAGAAV